MQTHETDVTSLVAGLVLIGISAVWALVETGAVSLSSLPVVVPVLLVAVGVVGVAVALARTRRTPSDDL